MCPDDFLNMCILSGCDYLDSLPGMGIVTANKHVRKYRDMTRLFRGLKFEGKVNARAHGGWKVYEERFKLARMTFKHARVWSTAEERVVHLNALPATVDARKLDYLGPPMDPQTARSIPQPRRQR